MSGDEREQAILETLERLLAERPLHELSIDEIARGAGISRPTFYFYFASKEAALLAIYTREGELFRAQTREMLDQLVDDPKRAVDHLVAATWDLWTERHPLLIAIAEASVTNDDIRAAADGVMTALVEQTAAGIEEARARGTVPPGSLPARDLAAALCLMVERVMYITFAGRAPAPDRRRTVATVTEVWLSTLGSV